MAVVFVYLFYCKHLVLLFLLPPPFIFIYYSDRQRGKKLVYENTPRAQYALENKRERNYIYTHCNTIMEVDSANGSVDSIYLLVVSNQTFSSDEKHNALNQINSSKTTTHNTHVINEPTNLFRLFLSP